MFISSHIWNFKGPITTGLTWAVSWYFLCKVLPLCTLCVWCFCYHWAVSLWQHKIQCQISSHLLKAITVRIHIWTLISVSRIVYVLYNDYINHQLLVYLTVKTIGNTWLEVKNKSNTTKNIKVQDNTTTTLLYDFLSRKNIDKTNKLTKAQWSTWNSKTSTYTCIYIYI